MPLRTRAIAAALCASLLSLAPDCYSSEGSGSTVRVTEQLAPPEAKQVLQRVRTAVTRNHLTRVPPQCLSFEVDDSPPAGMILVNVREKHHEGCSGDPATSPRLFSVRVSRKSNKMWTDAKSDSGEFEPLSR